MALVGAAVVGITSLSLAKANSIAIHSMGANSLAMQAQQYAASKAELLRSAKYSELTAQNKANIGNTGFQDEVTLGSESDYNSSTKKRDVTIKVYRTGESSPRSSVILTRYSKALDTGSGVPSGSIIPWYGNIADIPDGFALCNGSNGTPDLRDRFIVGAGSSYALRATGGAASVSLSVSQMPSHEHFLFYNAWSNNGRLSSLNYPAIQGHENLYTYQYGILGHTSVPNVGRSSPTGSSSAHENRPPFYALYYIMKL